MALVETIVSDFVINTTGAAWQAKSPPLCRGAASYPRLNA
jgi:hypothetical protein